MKRSLPEIYFCTALMNPQLSVNLHLACRAPESRQSRPVECFEAFLAKTSTAKSHQSADLKGDATCKRIQSVDTG